LRLPDFKTIGTWRQQGCQPHALAAFTARKYSWYSFLSEDELAQGHSAARRILSVKNPDTTRNRTHELSTCSAVPQPIAPPRAPKVNKQFQDYVIRREWLSELPIDISMDSTTTTL
jgi:hypothetical protein